MPLLSSSRSTDRRGAASATMALSRESTLPTINCSQCGGQVAISMMAQHMCNALPTPELSPSLETPKSETQATRNALRTPPPVDTRVADRYRSQGQITPVSDTSSSRDTSPKTPSRRSRTDRRYNDNYEPRIANADDGQLPSRGYGTRAGGYGGFGNQTPEPESTDAAEPPQKETPATSFFQSVTGLVNGYGGFSARPAMPPAEPEKPIQAQPKPEPEPQAEPEPSKNAPGIIKIINGIGAAFSGSVFDAGRRPPAPEQAESERLDATTDSSLSSANEDWKPSRTRNGYGGFDEPVSSDQAVRGMTRSKTFPRPTDPRSVSRSLSDAASQPDMHGRPPAALTRSGSGGVGWKSPLGPDVSRPPPPRNSLIPRSSSASVVAEKEFGPENPFHTPRNSKLSSYSSTSESSGSHPEHLVQRSKLERASRSQQSQQPPGPDSFRQPQRENARPELRIDPAIQAPQRGPGRTEDSPYGVSPYSTSPQDDRYQGERYQGERYQGERYRGDRYQGGRYDPAIQAGIDKGSRGNRQGASTRPSGNSSNGWSDRYDTSTPAAPAARRGHDGVATSSRRECMACGELITGRSISAADGRLPGKYHKECFVCAAPECRRPFPSAEFYIFEDRPYCHYDYHRLSGTLCTSCDKGIEGRYAEDESHAKYHVDCFCCSECGDSLEGGYFEVDGSVYCERHAYRPARTSALPPVSPMPVEGSYYDGGSGQLPPRVPPKSGGSGGGRGGQASRGVGAGMERGPYGVSPASYKLPRKRMTYIFGI